MQLTGLEHPSKGERISPGLAHPPNPQAQGREEAAAAAAGVAQGREQLTFAERLVSGGSHRSGCWELLPPLRTAPCSLPGATQGRADPVRFHFIRTDITVISKLFILRLIYVNAPFLSMVTAPHVICPPPRQTCPPGKASQLGTRKQGKHS